MPRVIVTTDPVDDRSPAVVYEEHVAEFELLESDHYAGQLLQRIGWGIADAQDAERESRPELAA
jgi:hypothetical protein